MINYRSHLVYKCLLIYFKNPASLPHYTVKSSQKANFAHPWMSCHVSIKNE